MKAAHVSLGQDYWVKVSGNLAKVRILRESEYGGWVGKNLATGREIRVKSAARLRFPALSDSYADDYRRASP
jgi:hypothetical protein